ncbi:PAS domain S-box protein [Methylobacterium sp. 092160098-2]|uniref:PAS domain S-box protein n=1 Tax=Methylobacterium sp. 092160098-2 TaxID=3025129 RepID=UPI002381A364|nr:PAS domain S-box protein [Methylobacterium sp. 092160098-2]MDE4914568.1 PAS domain S-box protein [Methylobacterium sp. 092160098-2]
MAVRAAESGDGTCATGGSAGWLRRQAAGVPGFVALCIFVFAASWWGIVSHHAGRVACIWLANPVVLSVLLRSPASRWPRWIGALVLGNFCADLTAGDDPALAAGLTAANTVEVLLGAGILGSIFGTGIDLTRIRDLRWFVPAAALFGPAASGLAAAVILHARGESFGAAWLTWFSADALGILTVTPLICICTPLRLRDVPPATRREIAAWTFVLAGVLGMAFSQSTYPILFLPVSILVHMGLRTGPLGAVIGIGATAVAAYVMTFNGLGPIAQVNPSNESQVLVLEAFLAGTVLAVLPVVAVLADRSRLERRLQEAETLFRGVFENSPEMLFVHRRGPDGRPVIEACNQAAADHLHVSRAVLEGKAVEAILGAEASLPVLEAVEAVFAGSGPIRQQVTYASATRGLVLEKIHVPLHDPGSGEVVRVVASIRDVTHIAEAESALRASEARRRLLADNTSDLIVELDLEANRTHISRSCRELLGYEPEELIGSSPLENVHADDLPSMVRCIGELKAGNDRATSTHRLQHKDGRWVWCESHWRRVRNDAGEDVGFVASVRNVEQRKSAEKELVQARMDAERAKRDAERASAAKSEFLATVSHEIRTPLNGIAGYTGLLLKDADLTPTQARYADRIRTASAALKTVVDDILDFSKIEAGQIALDPVAFRPRKLIDDVMSIVRGSSIGRGLRLESRVTPDLPELVLGDENRLRQVLLNLLNNAVKFTPAGEVVLHVEDRGPDRMGRRIRFRVRDTGIGIAPNQQARLFQRFSQIDGTIARRYGGTGLGLAISQQLVGLMGGEISVESRQGQGSEFSFEIAFQPATEADVDYGSVRPQHEECRPRRILVVEDVEVNRELALTVLRAAGHAVEAAVDGVEAVEKAGRNEYDLVLMDIQMPGMDGMAATRGIRALGGSRSELPIVAMTANVLPDQIDAIRAAGMNDHVGKPFEPQDLDRVIARWTGRADRSRETADAISEPSTSVFGKLVSAVGRETCMRLLDSFEHDLRESFVEEQPDRDALARDAHALKGEAGQLGFAELADACRDLEEACLEGRELAGPMARARTARERALEAIDTLRAA